MIMLNSTRGSVYVLGGNFEKATEMLREAEVKLRAMYNLDKIVYSFFFKAKTLFYFKKEDFEQYYMNSLQYLAYTDQTTLTALERQEICLNMAVSILVSPKIFNFSELLELEVF